MFKPFIYNIFFNLLIFLLKKKLVDIFIKKKNLLVFNIDDLAYEACNDYFT